MSAALEQDQEDLYGRLLAAPELSEVAMLLQRKGVTESDIITGLSVLNDRGAGKLGGIVIVLMPSLTLSNRANGTTQFTDAPGPLYYIDLVVQVIEMPLISQGDAGIGLSAEAMAQTVRTLGHHFSNGFGGTYVFSGMDPIPVTEGQISYGIHFTRQAGDGRTAKVIAPALTSAPAVDPDTGSDVTISCATAGASLLYSIDGSYPTLPYTVPVNVPGSATVRAVATKSGLLPSDVRQIVI